MLTLVRTSVFDEWLAKLADHRGKARILARLNSAAHGNFGDCAAVGAGVCEMRIHFGPGYRVYCVRNGSAVYLILCGGDKSTQQRDIGRAKQLASAIKDMDT